jgi:hypothetical protein
MTETYTAVVPSKTGPWSRLPAPGEVVRVYRNLNHKCWSIQVHVRDEQGRLLGWRVIAHARHVRLKCVAFERSESGAQRAACEGRKNVHAYVRGTYQRSEGPFAFEPWSSWSAVQYSLGDPGGFHVWGDYEGESVSFAEEVACTDQGGCYALNPQA